ncbi:MAG: hypothetical protein ACYDDF_07095 [Thermoplasmatota archaeon]
MLPQRFLAIHELPPDVEDEGIVEPLRTVLQAAQSRGVHIYETFYSLPRHMAWTFVEGRSAEDVEHAFLDAGVVAEVVEGDRIFTELLMEPRRAR